MQGKYLLGSSIVDGYLLEDGSNTLFLEFSSISFSGNLFIEGAANPGHSDDIELFIYGKEAITNDIDLFIFNSAIATSGIDLFITGHESINNDIELFIGQVPTEFTESLDLFIAGDLDISDEINLFISGPVPDATPINLDTVQVNASTSSGTQDITISGFGDVKAVFLYITNAVSGGVPVSGINLGAGLTDGTTTRSIAISSEETVPNAHVHSIGSASLIHLPDRTTHDIVASAFFDSFIEDGIRIDWDTPPPEGYTITALFIGGDLEVIAGTFQTLGTVGLSVDVDTGFEPDQLICLSNGFSFALDDTIQEAGQFCVGFADNGDTLSQGLMTFRLAGSASIGTPSILIYDGLVASRITGGSIVNSVEISGFNSLGFTASTAIANGATSVSYLAIKYNDQRRHFVGIVDSPIESGVQSFGSPGFSPDVVLQILTQVDTIDIVHSFDEAGALGFSLITPDKEYCTSINERSSTITSNQSLVDTQAINFPNESGGISFVANFDSMTSSGWALDFSSVEPIAKKWLVFAVEESSVVEVTNSINLFIVASGDTDSWNLFLKTPENDIATSRTLTIYGSPSGSSFGFTGDGIDFFIKSSILDSQYPPEASGHWSLFLKGEEDNNSNTGYWPLFLNSNTVDNNSIEFFITTIDRSTSGTIDLFIARIPDFPGQEGFTPIDDNWTLFLKTLNGSIDTIDMFISGVFASINNDIDTYIAGTFVIDDTLPLILYGVTGFVAEDINFFTDGIGFNESLIMLFIRGT